MALKIIISFFVSSLLSFHFTYTFGRDSIKHVFISDKLHADKWRESGSTYLDNPVFIDTTAKVLFFHFELNRINLITNKPFVIAEIKKKSLQQFRLRPVMSKKISLNENTIYTDSLDLQDSVFSSGNFDLLLTYMEDSFNVIDVKKAPFQLLRNRHGVMKDEYYSAESDGLANKVDIEKTFVTKYGLDQIKRNILSLLPLAQGIEAKVIRELSMSVDLLILKRFFYNFWYNRNPSAPETAWNEYTIILNYVAKKYGNSSTPGYETDRGRIYIQYGVPDRLERVVNEKGALPYEVWFYYRSGIKHNVKFLFFQPGMLSNDMYLLQSNIPDEIINPYWKDILLEDPTNGDNKLTHKVFEFFN